VNDERRIGILYGEGLGYELIEQSIRVLASVSQKCNIPFAFSFGPRVKKPAKTKRGIVNPLYAFYEKAIQDSIPILSGPLSGGLVYSIRKRFDLFYKLVPIRSIPGYRTEVITEPVDILLLRQNNAGEYFGRHGSLQGKDNKRIAFQHVRYTEDDVEKLASVAFQWARERRKKLTLFLKEDGLPAISRLWIDVFQEKRKEWEEVELEVLNVDRGAADLISSPSRFDVVATLNHDGDLLADMMISFLHGSRAMGCSGNFGQNGLAVYQTVHGSASDLVGKNTANPIGQILATAMMLEHSFGLLEEAELIRAGVEKALRNQYRTEDIFQGGCRHASTDAMVNAVVEAIRNT
jgi:3-isopropylmalate dehydrogenase